MSDQESSDLAKPTSWANMPPGIPYIVGNEAAERFSFYGMKAILFVYMTKYLLDAAGQPDPMSSEDARASLHLFVASAYFFPVAGAILSDWFLGKYRTIFWLSLVYCLGHVALATVPGRWGLLLGLTSIAVGAGGIKPCVSAHVGDQFSEHNKYLLPRVFSWFYFSINFGAFFSSILTPILLHRFGPHWGPHIAFGLPGLLMFIATFVFWLGRKKFVHVKPGGTAFLRETFSVEGFKSISGLIPIYLFVTIFWTLYDQTASAWVEQADSMDRKWMGVEWLSSQIQAVNPILVLILIPACTYGLYPAINSFFQLTSLRKVAIGFFITAFAFGLSAWIESQITGGKLIRNSHLESKNRSESQDKSDVEQAAVSRDHELIVGLREHRAWNIKSVSFQTKLVDSSKAANNGSIDKLQIQVEVGPTPNGPWSEKGVENFSDEIAGPHLVELPEPVSTAFVRLIVKEFVKSGESLTVDPIDWKEPQIDVLAAEPVPPTDAHPHAKDVWPNVAAMGHKPSISWQLVGYLILTLAEIMVSITCLEFSYTQAPNKMKSLVMSMFLLSVAAGNALTAYVNYFIQNADGTSKLPGASYYWFFTGLMATASIGFLFVVATYREKSYIQSSADAEPT